MLFVAMWIERVAAFRAMIPERHESIDGNSHNIGRSERLVIAPVADFDEIRADG